MAIVKYIFLFIIIYFLAILQVSFLSHFPVFGIIPNFLVIFLIAWNVFENPEKKFGIFLALAVGFMLDIFSSRPMGFNIIIMGSSAFILKFILKKYVQIPFAQ